jgi:hypothetical protein
MTRWTSSFHSPVVGAGVEFFGGKAITLSLLAVPAASRVDRWSSNIARASIAQLRRGNLSDRDWYYRAFAPLQFPYLIETSPAVAQPPGSGQ